MEANFVRPDWTHIKRQIQLITFAIKSLPALRTIFHDATSRRQTEAELLTLRKAVETSGEVIFLTDRDGLVTYVNPEFTRLYGYQVEDVVGRTTPRILKSGIMSADDYRRFWDTLLNQQVVKAEFINRCKDGSFVTVEGSASPIFNEGGDVVGFLAIQRDITQRVLAEEKIRRQNKELATLNAITTTVSQSLKLSQILNDALDEVLKLDMFGGMAKGMLFRLDAQKGWLSLIAHRGAPSNHPCLVQPPQFGECLCGLAAMQGEVIISEDCRADRRHTRNWAEMPGHKDICLPLKVRGEVLGVMNLRLPEDQDVASHDVQLLSSVADQIGVAIENARLFEAINEQNERLRALSSRLAEAEETERRRIAQELHDQVGQKLTALGINLNIIRAEMPQDGPQKVDSYLTESQTLVEETTQLIRGVMSDLRPPMLDDLGLVETLLWYGDQIATRTGLSIAVKGDQLVRRLPAHIEDALFRITQESLTNVVKHAKAKEVEIKVELVGSSARLVVADDGTGYQSGHLLKPGEEHGWGLLIMAERAEAMGGRCWIESDPIQGGTRVIAEVPI